MRNICWHDIQISLDQVNKSSSSQALYMSLLASGFDVRPHHYMAPHINWIVTALQTTALFVKFDGLDARLYLKVVWSREDRGTNSRNLGIVIQALLLLVLPLPDSTISFLLCNAPPTCNPVFVSMFHLHHQIIKKYQWLINYFINKKYVKTLCCLHADVAVVGHNFQCLIAITEY